MTQDIANMFKVSKMTTENHQNQCVYVSHFAVCLPHTHTHTHT